MVLFWWLKMRVPAQIIERTVKNIQETQDDNAKARTSHIKATRRKLRALGIKLTDIERCTWDTS
jgi:hypothetical protein